MDTQKPVEPNDGMTSASVDLPVVKNQSRIDEVRARMATSEDAIITTSTMSRIIRKDWNIVTTKLYISCLKSPLRGKIQESLAELHWEVEDLSSNPAVTMFQNLDSSWLQEIPFSLKIVSPEAASWFRAIKTIDRCIAKMMTAERAGLLEKKQRLAALAGVNMAYTAFKYMAMDKPIPQKAEAVFG